MRLAMHRGRVGDAQVAAHVDRGIGGRRGCGAEGPRHGSDEWPHGDCDFRQDARDTKAWGLHAQETPGRTGSLTMPIPLSVYGLQRQRCWRRTIRGSAVSNNHAKGQRRRL